jgi:hypothetical protein
VSAPPRRPKSDGLAGRAIWVTLDQAVSSIANAALSLVLASTVSAQQFGTFALAFSVYSFLVGVSQAVGGQILVIRFTARRPRRPAPGRRPCRRQRRAGGCGRRRADARGPGRRRPAGSGRRRLRRGAAAGAAPPGRLATVLVSAGTPKRAFVNDVVWTGLQLVLVVGLLAYDVTAAVWYVLAWGGSAVVAAALGVRQAGQPPVLVGGLAWVREHARSPATCSPSGSRCWGPPRSPSSCWPPSAASRPSAPCARPRRCSVPSTWWAWPSPRSPCPELVRARPGAGGCCSRGVALSGLMIVVDAAWGAILLLMPDHVGEALLGETWGSAREALPGLVLFTVAIGATTGPALLFRALDRTQYVFWTSAALGPLILVLSVAGQLLGGVRGAAYGFALAAALVVLPALVLGRAGRAPAYRLRGRGRWLGCRA